MRTSFSPRNTGKVPRRPAHQGVQLERSGIPEFLTGFSMFQTRSDGSVRFFRISKIVYRGVFGLKEIDALKRRDGQSKL